MIPECFFALLRAGLLGQEMNVNPTDCSAIFKLACEHGVQAIIWDGIANKYQLPKITKLQWALSVESIEKTYYHQYKVASQIASLFESQCIKMVILKGIDASLNYPMPNHRPCGDIDCFLLGNYELGNKLLEEGGAIVDRTWYKHSHIDYYGVTIENHQFCTQIRGSSKVKRFEMVLQNILNNEPLISIGDTYMLSPHPLFTALFLTYHAKGHFLSEGIALRHLCDWALFINNKGTMVDWDKFNELANNFDLKKFADSMTRLSAKLFGVNIYYCDVDDERDSFLLNEILNSHQHICSRKGNKFHKRILLIKSIFTNSKRYSLFSESSFLKVLLQKIFGYLFDKQPIV